MRAFIALLLVAIATAELAPLYENSEPIPGKYIIRLKKEVNVDEMVATVRLFGGKPGLIFRYVVNGFAAELSDDVLDIVRSLPAVQYVEQEGIVRPEAVTWGLDRIDQTYLPLDGRYEPFGYAGKGYTVWVIDSGVRETHVQFEGRAQQVVNYADSYNTDCYGHGTHCAGTVGAKDYGVATEVNIKGVKIFDCNGYGTGSWLIKGIDYVRKYADKYSIASMSLGSSASKTTDDAVEDLIASGVPTAVAAGNQEDNACNRSPARTPSAITVGATDWNDLRAEFSNWGPCLDIYAPGVYIDSLGYKHDYELDVKSGTSMACPHVAGNGGKGYTVWVIDSGIRETHVQFEGRAQQVVTFADNYNYDCYGHGSHCAGTVGAKDYGVATEVTIKSVKIFDCNGYATTSYVIKGIDYVKKYADRYSIASMSIGGGRSSSMDDATEELIASGVPAAVAAGNEEDNACNHSPAAAPSAITVGATDWNDLRAEFSNWGPCLDIYAPGVYIDSLGYKHDYELDVKSGTSMACPHVAGAIALYQKNTDNLIKYSNTGKLGWLSSSCPNKLLYV